MHRPFGSSVPSPGPSCPTGGRCSHSRAHKRSTNLQKKNIFLVRFRTIFVRCRTTTRGETCEPKGSQLISPLLRARAQGACAHRVTHVPTQARHRPLPVFADFRPTSVYDTIRKIRSSYGDTYVRLGQNFMTDYARCNMFHYARHIKRGRAECEPKGSQPPLSP